MTLRVCIVAGSHPPMLCGIGDYTAPLAAALSSLSVDVCVLVSSEVLSTQTPKHPNTQTPKQLTTYRLVAAPGWSLRHVSSLKKLVEAEQPELLHVIYPGAAYGFGLAPILLPYAVRRLPKVLTLHEFKMAKLPRKLADFMLMKASNKIIVPSASERDAIARWSKTQGRKVIVGTAGPTIPPLPMSEKERKAQRQRLGAGDDLMLIAYFGFIHPNKGSHFAIQAFAAAVKQDQSLRLVVVGAIEPKRNEYHRQVLELAWKEGVAEKIVWLGALPPSEVSKTLQVCDCALLPFPDGVSTRRGTLIVCLQHGLPVVTVKGEPEAHQRFGEPMLCVERADDIEGMAKLLMQLRRNDGERLRLAQLARSQAPDWFEAWQNIARHTLQVYHSILGKSGEPSEMGY